MLELLGVVIALLLAAAVGATAYMVAKSSTEKRLRSETRTADEAIAKLIDETKTQQRELILEAKDEAIKIKAGFESELRERRADLHRQERRIQQKEENLEHRTEAQEKREHTLITKEQETERLRQEADDLKLVQLRELERISGMTSEEAKEVLLHAIESEIREDAGRRVREIEMEAREDAGRRARQVVVLAIQRCAADQVAETTVSVVPLPSDDMKGRIIGREGRNIRALESATGIDLIIDDTPDAVTLSGFDPVRREVARLSLQKLIADGRIHPARIEEVVQKAKQEVDQIMKEEGEAAAIRASVHGLNPELIRLIGRLKYRTSYGQNVLQHSVEVSHIAGVIAAELGADVQVARTAGLLHDIGKGLSHEVEGPHALIGAELVKRYGKSPKIVSAVGNHHSEMDEPQSIEAAIVQAADAISGARPGARRETVENYVKRLEALESVANSFGGVEKSFAIQAGREVRIIVKPDEIDDLSAIRLARDIVRKIEETLEYPGQIKVTVLRETRAVDYAK